MSRATSRISRAGARPRRARRCGIADSRRRARRCATRDCESVRDGSVGHVPHPTSIPVAYITANPAERPAAIGAEANRSAIGRGAGHLSRQSGARPARWRRRRGRERTPRRPANRRGRRATRRRSSAAPPISPSRTSVAHRRPLVRDRRDDRQPLGRVVQREADDEQRAERRLAERERRADGEALRRSCAGRCRPR